MKTHQNYIKAVVSLALKNDLRITAFPVRDNGERLDSLRSISGLVFDDPDEKYLAREAVSKLIQKVITSLNPLGFTLYITDAYRPLPTQERYWNDSLAATRSKYPEITDETEIIRRASRFTAPPNRAQHCTGGAVDVFLYDLEKGLIVDDFDDSDNSQYTEYMYTDNPEVPEQERKNRQILKSAMEAVGFVNYPLEWWHYSYGNAEWAIYTGRDFAVYGQITQ